MPDSNPKPPVPPKVRSRLLAQNIVGAAFFMYALDSTIVATAMPQMATSFGVNPVQLSIAIVAYVVSLAVFVPISGWLADRFGASVTFASAIAVFTVGSLLCGLSQSLLELAAARVLQGFGGAMLLPVGRLVALRGVPKTGFVKALAMLGLFPSIGGMLGPPVGGFITTYTSWRWIFLINIPIGIVGLVLVILFVENIREAARQPLDWVGFILTGVALSSDMYGLEAIGRGTTDLVPMAGLVGFGLVVGVFAVAHANRHAHPLLDLSLLRIPTFRQNMTGGSLFRMIAGGMPFLLPLLFQVVFGMTAFASGTLILALALGVLSVRIIVQRLLRTLGFRTALLVNGLLSSLGAATCSLLTASTPAVLIVLLLFAVGFVQGCQFTSLNTLAYADIAPSRMSAATSLAQLSQQLSQGIGVAAAASLLHGALVWRGATMLAKSDFVIAFLGLAVFGLLSVQSFWRMAPEAGIEVSGHRPKSLEHKP